MQINFTHIFQDSWNFIRNQRVFAMSFAIFFFLLTFTTQALLDTMLPAIMQQLQNQNVSLSSELPASINQTASLMTNSNIMLISLISQIINSLLSTWALIAIHQISQHNQFSFAQTFTLSIKYFLAVLILSVLVIFPLLYGAINLLLGSLLGLVLTLLGIYIFLRLCLSPLIYLFENKSFFSAIQYCWQQTNKRLGTLAIYCLIVYVLFSLIANQLAGLNQNLFIQIITTALHSIITVFSLVFSYRFYHLFIHQR
ncbi:uncharacterized protein UPF0259 [Volucribacter psittacicida]|uniref:Uncharacterized protein UPF0259 n=1 Tax=Volucribacter psittacicida TaxID=203482 RepID=A0A4V2PCJ3_9PAST|nr:hypothetical protein [Volucribacter psittacicida]TCK01596.1 uncharacterized protein UPF0259 [Volucribacter psittacicida]